LPRLVVLLDGENAKTGSALPKAATCIAREPVEEVEKTKPIGWHRTPMVTSANSTRQKIK